MNRLLTKLIFFAGTFLQAFILSDQAFAYGKGSPYLFGFLFNSDNTTGMTFNSQLGAVCENNSSMVLDSIAKTRTLFVSLSGRMVQAQYAGMTVDGKSFEANKAYCDFSGSKFYSNTYVIIKLAGTQVRLPVNGEAGVIAAAPPPAQSWNSVTASCSGVPMQPDKYLKSMGSRCTLITVGKKSQLMLRSVTLDDSVSDDPVATYSCQIYIHKGGIWSFLFKRTSVYMPCKPLLDADGHGVPDLFIYDDDPIGPALFRILPEQGSLYHLGDESDTAW